MSRVLLLFLLACELAVGASPVYVVLWFDTEDYIEPAADDAALRIASDLDSLGVRATFKVVGEKARVLESRGRNDVIRALSRHDIGYHAENHSIPPTPAVYLRPLGFLEGADEFERREGQGIRDIQRIFGVTPSCYGQPGSSWGPQSYPALRRLGIPVYLDEATHVGVNSQPFWYGGLLHVFHMGRFVMRASLDDAAKLDAAFHQFDEAAAELARGSGGVISIYYHPTEFVTAEFWDAVNFSHGAGPERSQWVRPKLRSAEDANRAFSILRRYAEHAKSVPGVRFVTARDLLQLYASPAVPRLESKAARHILAKSITFAEVGGASFSAADLLQAALGVDPRPVDGPLARTSTTYRAAQIPRAAFDRASADAAGYIRTRSRLPSSVWIGSAQLSLADFAATLATDDGETAQVAVRKGSLAFEQYVSSEPAKAFDWVIHPEGFKAPELLEMGRLQAWTLKPARLR
jgi:hypothetical protein